MIAETTLMDTMDNTTETTVESTAETIAEETEATNGTLLFIFNYLSGKFHFIYTYRKF